MSRGAIVVTIVAAIVGVAAAVGIVMAATGQSSNDDPIKRERTTREADDNPDRGLGNAEAAARTFMSGYLPLIYGRKGATVDKIRGANAAVMSALRADPGRVPAAQAAATYKLERVTVIENRPGDASATATIRDNTGSPAYPINFRLNDVPGRGWQVYRLAP